MIKSPEFGVVLSQRGGKVDVPHRSDGSVRRLGAPAPDHPRESRRHRRLDRGSARGDELHR